MCQADNRDACASHQSNDATESAEGKDRSGMPGKESVLSEKTFTSPKGKHYRIIRTDEMDQYDDPVPPEEQPRQQR